MPTLALSLHALARAALALLPARPRSLAAVLRALAALVLATVRRIVAPSCCAACDAAAPFDAAFCPACARTVKPFSPPTTDALPEAPAVPPTESPADPLAYAPYEGALARAVRRFKYGDRSDLARPLGALLRGVARAAHLRADLVVPVPLHPARLRDRGFNQAALLAAAVASEIRAPLAARALVRARHTRAQASLDRAARLTNLDGSIRVRSRTDVRGRHLVLVDDVSTTGSTLDACRRALLAAGAARVTPLVLARRAVLTTDAAVRPRSPGPSGEGAGVTAGRAGCEEDDGGSPPPLPAHERSVALPARRRRKRTAAGDCS